MRIAVNLVIEMTLEQVQDYCREYGHDPSDSKEIRDSIKSYILTGVQGCAAGDFWTATAR